MNWDTRLILAVGDESVTCVVFCRMQHDILTWKKGSYDDILTGRLKGCSIFGFNNILKIHKRHVCRVCFIIVNYVTNINEIWNRLQRTKKIIFIKKNLSSTQNINKHFNPIITNRVSWKCALFQHEINQVRILRIKFRRWKTNSVCGFWECDDMQERMRTMFWDINYVGTCVQNWSDIVRGSRTASSTTGKQRRYQFIWIKRINHLIYSIILYVG